MKEPDTLGERIRFLLERKGLTQKELAFYLREQHNQGATLANVNRWVNDKAMPRSETIRYIAEFLNTTTAYLQGEIPLSWSPEKLKQTEQQVKNGLLLINYLDSQGYDLTTYNEDEGNKILDEINDFIDFTFSKHKKKGRIEMKFDYSKLLGKITEVCGTQAVFANSMNLSERSISLKLNNKEYFAEEEIVKAMKVLKIKENEVSDYFFKLKGE